MRTIYSLLGLTLLAGCPVLDVEADVKEACATYPNVQVAAQPAGATSVDQSFTVANLDTFQTLVGQGFHLTFERAEARATSGISSFAFVQTASLELASGDPSSTLPTVPIFTCDHCGADAPALDVAAAADTLADPYIESGSLVVAVTLAGAAPPVAWTMDVDVCVTGSGSYQYNP